MPPLSPVIQDGICHYLLAKLLVIQRLIDISFGTLSLAVYLKYSLVSLVVRIVLVFVFQAGVLHSDNHQSSVIALAPIMASSSGFVFVFAFVCINQ